MRLSFSVFGLFAIATVIAPCAQFGIAQQPSSVEDVFSPIPQQHRARLRERLNLLIQYQSKQDWPKLYDLLVPEWRPMSKEAYVGENKWSTGRLKLSQFTPEFVGTEVYAVDGNLDTSQFNEWIISGCAEFGRGWPKEKYSAHTTARLENGNWFFSEISVTFEAIDGPPASCKKRKK